jgi:hypothetical protein
MPVNPDDRFKCQVRKAGSSVAYQAADGRWTVWTPQPGEKPLWEIAFAYSGGEISGGLENKAWARFPFANLDIEANRTYYFRDLAGNTEGFTISVWNLINDLPVGLNPGCNRHHFIVS